jgi:hypothetical protein
MRDSKHLWNVGYFLSDYMPQYARRQTYSYSTPWEPETSSSSSSERSTSRQFPYWKNQAKAELRRQSTVLSVSDIIKQCSDWVTHMTAQTCRADDVALLRCDIAWTHTVRTVCFGETYCFHPQDWRWYFDLHVHTGSKPRTTVIFTAVRTSNLMFTVVSSSRQN